MGIAERRKREQERKRHEILIAAKKLFCSRGYGHSKISDIAKEAEISPGSIYLHFKSKEELFIALTSRLFHYLKMRLTYVDESKKLLPIEKRLEAVCDALTNTYEHDPRMMTLTLYMQGSFLFESKSGQMISPFKSQLRNIIFIISDLIKGNSPEIENIHQPGTTAKLIWSQFTGAVLLNGSLNTIEQDGKQTLLDDLSLWIKVAAALPFVNPLNDSCLGSVQGGDKF